MYNQVNDSSTQNSYYLVTTQPSQLFKWHDPLALQARHSLESLHYLRVQTFEELDVHTRWHTLEVTQSVYKMIRPTT